MSAASTQRSPRHAETTEAAELVGDASEDADAKADKQRRRIQNRKNQRARRLQLKGKDAEAGQRLRPFEISRWRLDEHDVGSSEETSPALGGISTIHTSPRPLYTRTGFSPSIIEHTIVPPESRLATAHLQPSSSTLDHTQPFAFPLSSDHLLHLIQHNVLRAFVTNKHAILNIPPAGDPTTCPTSGPYQQQVFNPNIPPSLAPTTLQQNRHHSPWVDVIPFPRIRDNFIRLEGLFDHWDLMYDLVGATMNSVPAACVGGIPAATRRPPLPTLPQSGSTSDAYEDEVTSGRKGLIVWGEPHEMQSWEATPGFLAKWAWAVEGCEELVEISNRWRMRRGEEPMRLSVLGSWLAPPPPLTPAEIGRVERPRCE